LKEGYCRICEFFRKHPCLKSQEDFFEAKVHEGVSLRKLELILEAFGCKAKKDLIARHIRECIGIERTNEAKKESIKQKLRGFFIKPKELPSSCKHETTRQYYDMESEKVIIQCTKCHKILTSYDPEALERRMLKDKRNQILYEALRRNRK